MTTVRSAIAFSAHRLSLILAFGIGFSVTGWIRPLRGDEAGSTVTVEHIADGFQLMRNGQAYRIHGVGGETKLAELAAAGGNSIRTWDANDLGKILDAADQHGLTVCAGLWLGHPRHGFDYHNEAAVWKQLNDTLAVVRRYKNHPALLMWAVGNEAEGDGKDAAVWMAINQVAREIKLIDPSHPTMTVIAELGEQESKIHSIERFCPDIDVVGVNSYGGIESVGQRYRRAGGSKPYVVTEHGPLGPWEVGKTPWGAPIEMTSTEKARWYANGYRAAVLQQRNVCFGSYAFLWGFKQETTATWFGMWLADGGRLEPVDVMSEFWTGRPPENCCPKIEPVQITPSDRLQPGMQLNASVRASDPEGDPITYRWVLRSDSATIGTGGDPQRDELVIQDAVKQQRDQATVTMPDEMGGYRLFAYVYDDHGGAAVANVPLQVRGESIEPTGPTTSDRKPTEALSPVALPYIIYADPEAGGQNPPSVFVPSGFMGNTDALEFNPDSPEQPHSGKTCLRIRYRSPGSWGGVLWQSPPGDWEGEKPGGANLSGATQLEFWARGKEGGEVVNFVFGVLDGNQPYRDSAKGELKEMRLTKEWNKMVIPLRGLDLSQIKTGFGFSLAGQGRPVTFYLDDIRYVKQ